MAFVVVSDRSEFLVKGNCWSVPFKDLEVNTIKIPCQGDSRDSTKQALTYAAAAIFGRYVNILEVNAALSAKTCKIWEK